MPALATLASSLSLLQAMALLALIVTLARNKLARRYPALWLYAAFELLRHAAIALMDKASNAYGYLYFFTQPVLWALSAALILEAFHVSLRHHPGIAAFARRGVVLAVAFATVAATATILVRPEIPESPYVVLERFFLVERFISVALLVLALTLLGFLAYFPVPLTRNARTYAAITGLLLVLRVTLYAVRVLEGPSVNETVSLLLVVVSTSALLGWAFLLRPAGETAPVRSGFRTDPAREDMLLAQLESINRTLTKTNRQN